MYKKGKKRKRVVNDFMVTSMEYLITFVKD